MILHFSAVCSTSIHIYTLKMHNKKENSKQNAHSILIPK